MQAWTASDISSLIIHTLQSTGLVVSRLPKVRRFQPGVLLFTSTAPIF